MTQENWQVFSNASIYSYKKTPDTRVLSPYLVLFIMQITTYL